MRKIELFMKKYAFLCLLVLVTFVQTGCVFQTDSHTPDCKFHTKTIDLPVKQNEWMYDINNDQFYAHFELKEITANIYNYGNFSIHREYNSGLNAAYQVALPESKFMTEVINNNGTQTILYYTQLVDYRVGVGYVDIQVTNSDFSYPIDDQKNLINPEEMLFRLQLIY